MSGERKKMSASKAQTLVREKEFGFVDYLPCVVKHNAHGWSIEYHAFDPATGKLKRHASKLNNLRKHYKSLADFKAHVTRICIQINGQLAGGWTPFGESRNARMLMPVRMVADTYIKEKETELRPDTMRSYKSFRKVFTDWVDAECKGMSIGSVNRLVAVRFMDYLFAGGLRGRAYNNRLKQGRAFFSWCVEKCYAKENPFTSIKSKREEPKKRIVVPRDAREQINNYLESRNPGQKVLFLLVFDSLIRPMEAWRLKIENLHLDEFYIQIDESISKTHFSRIATLTPQTVAMLRDMTTGHGKDEFLFGPKYVPGKKHIRYQNFREDWSKMREELHLPKQMQLYSLRDSGINEMLKSGIDALTVMQHADHHDLSMTTRYANHADPRLVETIREKAPRF
jgi:integrase